MDKKLYKAKVIDGNYKGRIGRATEPNKLNLVMFYPIEGTHPYRVCLSADNIKYYEVVK